MSHPNQSKEEVGNQAKIEACDILSALLQCGSSEPSMMVVRRHSNTPHIPRGTAHSLYLDVGTLSWGASSAQFPLDRLHLCHLFPFTRNGVLLPCEEGEERLQTYPHLLEILWESSKEDHYLSNLISLSVPTSAPPSHQEEGTQTKRGSDHHPTSTQTEEGSGYHPSLKLLQDATQARA